MQMQLATCFTHCSLKDCGGGSHDLETTAAVQLPVG